MSDKFDILTDEEVRQIAVLVEKLDQSRFDFLQLNVGNVKLTLGKGDFVSASVSHDTSTHSPSLPSGTLPQNAAASEAIGDTAVTLVGTPQQPTARESEIQDGTVAIVAPMMGQFYAKPDPEAAPFVTVGSEVTANTTVGLIEVMKVFTAVSAGESGVISEICVQDTQFIEYGQVLFRVTPR